jgi:nucleotide-binding universal stress UspA family protein
MQLLELHTQIKLNNILLLTDFSSPSEHALPFAAAMARRFQSKIFVTHIPPAVPIESIPIEPMPLDLDALKQNAEQRLNTVGDSALLDGIDHEQLLFEGPIEPSVHRIARQHDIDLIILGTHGRAGIKKLLLGSVAEEIFRNASCPVLTVGPHVPAYSQERDRIGNVLFATDFSPASTKALPFAVALAQENKAELTLMHVIESTTENVAVSSHLYQAAMGRLSDLLPSDAVNWCEPEFHVEAGLAPDEILRAANQRHTGLIVLGVHHAARLASHIPWAVAYSVVRRADCPVLTVRA